MMTTEEQIIAVAGFMGWKCYPYVVINRRRYEGPHWTPAKNFDPDNPPAGESASLLNNMPAYATDLNAIHGVEEKLHTTGDWPKYVNEVFMLVVGDRKDADLDGLTLWPMLHASASTRLEALCRTLWPEKWKE